MGKKPKLSTLTPDEYERRLKKIILAGLGKAWMFWPVRAEAKRRCKDPNRSGWSICELCHQSREKLDTDHIEPCVSPIDGLVSWDEYIKRRFVFDARQLQCICKDCHRKKTKEENAKRRINKEKKMSQITDGDTSPKPSLYENAVCISCGRRVYMNELYGAFGMCSQCLEDGFGEHNGG